MPPCVNTPLFSTKRIKISIVNTMSCLVTCNFVTQAVLFPRGGAYCFIDFLVYAGDAFSMPDVSDDLCLVTRGATYQIYFTMVDLYYVAQLLFLNCPFFSREGVLHIFGGSAAVHPSFRPGVSSA